jgi:hypothetical protein
VKILDISRSAAKNLARGEKDMQWLYFWRFSLDMANLPGTS